MEIDWSRVRRVILNDRILGYKPDRECIDKLASKLPDVRIHGFGYYGFLNIWYVFAESKYFLPIEDAQVSNIAMNNIPKMNPEVKAVTRSPKPWEPTDPTKPTG